MTNSVTFPTLLGGNGLTYTDDSNTLTGLANGGHRPRFVPTLSQTVIMAQTAVTNATNAASSASAASTSAGNAAADAVDTAADAVATAADRVQTGLDAAAAAAALDAFDDRWLGSKASDPSLDNDGNALAEGAQYFNTTTDRVKYYTGSQWNTAYADSVDVLHTATGTGALATTVQAKLLTFLTDGDHSTAQQTAIAALNKTYFVAPAAAITLTVPTDCATLAAALTAIARWIIPDNATVTIQLPTGATALSAPTVINHPYGAQISIVGAATVSTTATAAGAVTGSAGAWAVPLTVADATGIAANDYAIVSGVTGTGRYLLFSGLCKVTAVVGSLVTVTNTAKNAAWPTAALTTANIKVIKSVVTYTGCDGIKLDGPLGNLDRVVLVGNKTAGTIGMITQRAGEGSKGKAYVYCGASVGISGFGDGGVYAQYNGTVDAPYLAVADCLVYNVLAQHNGSVMMNNGISTGCTEAGIASSSGGSVSFEAGTSCGNGTYGLFAFQNGSVLAQTSFTWANVSDGFRSAWGGSIRGTTMNSQYNGGNGGFCVGGAIVATGSIASNNTGVGLYAEGGGNIYASTTTASSNGSYGLYADGGVIDAPSVVVASNGINGATATNGGIIQADGLSGASNVTYQCSATKGGVIRATTAVTAGATSFAETLGLIDLTGATGTPVLSYGNEGRFITTAGVLVCGPVRIGKDSLYNSEGSAGLIVQNATAPLKMLYGGYDNTRDYAFLQSVNSTNGYKDMALQPNGANLGVGLGTTLPTARLHLPAGAAGTGLAPLKFTSGTNLTTASAGAMEYNGTNLFFTRAGTTREGVLTQSAVTTEAVASDTTVTVNIGGTTYKLLARA